MGKKGHKVFDTVRYYVPSGGKMYAQEFSWGSCSIKKHRDGARHFFIDHPSRSLSGIHLNRALN